MILEWHRLKTEEPFPDAYYAYTEPILRSARPASKMVVAAIGYHVGRGLRKRWGLFHVVDGAPVWCLSEWKTAKAAKEAGERWVENRQAIDAKVKA